MRYVVLTGLVTCLMVSLAGAEPVADDTKPMAAGKTHHLKFDFKYDGKTEMMTYGLYLPPQAEQVFAEGGKLPLVVFMVGAGSRGQTEERLHREGPLGGIKRSEQFAKTVDYAVLVPQVPRQHRWENPRMGQFVADATRRVVERWPIDPDRVYLVGSSMGGEGSWHAGLAGADMYAVVACVAGRGHPRPQALAAALKDRTVLIIVGSGDEDFTTGSQKMADAFNDVGVDVLHVVIPGRGHGVGGFYLNQPRFYEWLLAHRRDGPAPKDRADVDELRRWATNPPGDQSYRKFSERLQEKFHTFRPYWFVELCGQDDLAGPHLKMLGRKDVFVTHPLNGAIPCRIMHTTTVPRDKKTTLRLEVAHAEGEAWELVVNIDCFRQLRKRVGPKTKGGSPWRTYDVDLTGYAGREVFIEVLNKTARKHKPHNAYWGKIEIISEDF